MKEVSVALSGSGFRFPAHIGALQGIMDAGYTITDIAGTSGGSIVAACFAKGISPAEMQKLAHEAPFQSFISFNLEEVILKNSLNDGQALLNWLNQCLGANTTFREIAMPLSVVSTDLNDYGSFIFNKKNSPDFPVALACRASSSIPFVFEPVVIQDKYLVDGGLCDDLPVDSLLKDSLKFAVELFEADAKLQGNVSILTLVNRIIDTLMTSGNYDHLNNASNCTPILVTTPAGLSLDTNMSHDQIDQLYNLGYKAALAIASNI